MTFMQEQQLLHLQLMVVAVVGHHLPLVEQSVTMR
jgi:hypothetical protein